MFNSRRKAHPVALLPVIFSILVLVSYASTARGQVVKPPPVWSDTITTPSQFLLCRDNPYALCYYSGPDTAPTSINPDVPALPCIMSSKNGEATCTCYAIYDGGDNFVAITSILNASVMAETIAKCNKDGSDCLNLGNQNETCNGEYGEPPCTRAPVCENLGKVVDGVQVKTQNLHDAGDLISTFSFDKTDDYQSPIETTSCNDNPNESTILYAGCMTARCQLRTNMPEGEQLADCTCPTYIGPFQFGLSDPSLNCWIGPATVWSASNSSSCPNCPEP